jgi:streptogramin lyase
MEDQSGTIWIGSHLGKGLNKLERTSSKFKQVSKDINYINGLNDDVVWAITEDRDKNLWLGTYKGGLNKWDRNKNKFLYFLPDQNNSESISDSHIRALCYDERGFLWIGTYSGGLNLYNFSKNSFTRFIHNTNDTTSLGANQVQAIFIDSEKNIWVGTFGGGLNKMDAFNIVPSKIRFKKYKNDPNDPFSLSDDRVYSIYEDKDKVLWIGTFGGGLNRFDKKKEKFVSYKNIAGDESSLSDNRVMSIYEDSNGILWISTYGGGLLKFDKRSEKFTRYLHNRRITSSAVYGTLEDNFGNLWMSSDNGLFKYNVRLNQFTQYNLNDGLQSLEFSGGAYYKSESGHMYFGGINGFNYFYPDSVRDNYYVPPVVISSVRIFNEPIIGEVDSINVSYDQNFLSIEFSALDFTNPADNQYAYTLEGLDDEWHYVDSRMRIANFTNLSPGKYLFRVRGSNNDGVWNNVGAELHIFISPPYWQTWWFITLVILFISGIIYFLSTMRYRNLLSIEKLKSKLSADLHDNIGSGLTEISILSDLAANDIISNSRDSLSKLNIISDKARQLIDNMSDIVWMVNPHRDSLYHVILRLKDSYSDFLNSMAISFEAVNLEKFSAIKLPMEYKQNLFLIFKEAINNSIKHSRCKKIILEANLEKDILELTMKDDGTGLDFHNIQYGNGILNMKSRAKVIGGKLSIDSSNSGTIIKFTGKIKGFNKMTRQ